MNTRLPVQRQPASLGTYPATWAALIALLLLTLETAFLPLGRWNVAITAISVTQTLLAMTMFMYLHTELPVVRLAAAVGFVWLEFMFV